MATTVTYKGETLATVRNDTKTLKTGGTWVEGDIGITDETSTAVVAVEDVPDSHGGIEKRITAVDISDTDATASDVAEGKVFYSGTGVRTTGTAFVGGEDLLKFITYEGLPETFVDSSIETLGVLLQQSPVVTLNMKVLKNLKYGNGMSWNKSLVTAVFPSMVKTGYDQLRGCSKLEIVDLGASIQTVDNWTFEDCPLLETVIIRSASVPQVYTSAFSSTAKFKQGGTGGEIFVPSALIDSYKSATNWSTMDAWGTITWKAIEGSQYENYYADGSEVTA